jgi:signal transduction histidine kinase
MKNPQTGAQDNYREKQEAGMRLATLLPLPTTLPAALMARTPEWKPEEELTGTMAASRTLTESANTILRRREAIEGAMRTMAGPMPTPEARAIAEAVHDARNLLTALGLYCDLLEEPGVLSEGFQHYGRELRLVTSATRRLIEKISAATPAGGGGVKHSTLSARPDGLTLSALPSSRTAFLPMAAPFPSRQFATNLASAVAENRSLLTALAGPAVTVEANTASGAHNVALAGEDLTRILVNLVRNAAEAMPNGGRIRITTSDGYFSNPQPNLATEAHNAEKTQPPRTVLLDIEDSGPGLSKEAVGNIFEIGFSTKLDLKDSEERSWPCSHRGLGLAIVRALAETAGGTIRLVERSTQKATEADAYTGACFRIELPVC